MEETKNNINDLYCIVAPTRIKIGEERGYNIWSCKCDELNKPIKQ